MTNIYQPYPLGDLQLRNPIVMAPLTRGFADDQTGEVNQLIADYYGRRARFGVGLIISEGIAINPTAKGTFGIPGLYTEKQITSWKLVTERVHQEGGLIFAQLWHVGRLSHSSLINGKQPVAPSAVRADGLVHKVKKPYELPVELTIKQIDDLIHDYQKAAENAVKSGFDGVEIHGAHGYLIDQFINEKTNLRNDNFGGSLEKRLNFLDRVVGSISKVISPEKISVRISEKKDDDPSYYWKNPTETLSKILAVLTKHNIKILHISVNDFKQPLKKDLKTLHELARSQWSHTLIGVGNISPTDAEEIIQSKEVDLIAFGRPFIANPDLILKMKSRNIIDTTNYSLNILY